MTRDNIDKKLISIRAMYYEKRDYQNLLRGYNSVLAEAERIGAEPDALAICCRDIADILYEMGRKREAYQMYDRSLSCNVSDTDIKVQTLMNKGLSQFQDGNKEVGKSLLEEAMQLEVFNPTLKYFLVLNYRNLLRLLDKKIEPERHLLTQRLWKKEE